MRDEYIRTIEPARALAAETLKLERTRKGKCRMQNVECRVILLRLLQPGPGGHPDHVENRPAPHARPAGHNMIRSPAAEAT